jgi:hypothetical protein
MTTPSSAAQVQRLQRLEGLVVLAGSIAAYQEWAPHGWGYFLLLFLVPDLSMLGYLRSPQLGATIYNLGHTYLGPGLLLLVASVLDLPEVGAVGLIWTGHIGFDRLLGYGLKLPSSFRETHLGWIGRAKG